MESQQKSVDVYMSALRLPRLILVQMALRAAIELQVFDIIAQSGPHAKLSASDIVSKIPTKNPNAAPVLNRILRMLSTDSILSASSKPCSKSGNNQFETVYGLTEVSHHLVSDAAGGKRLSSMVLLCSEKEGIDCLYGLKDSVLEPDRLPVYDSYHGVGFFEHAAEKPRLTKLFVEGGVEYNSILMDQILKAYKGFQDLSEVMDVGGGCGKSLEKIVSLYPHVHGINFDSPHVIAHAPVYPGIDHVEGDMFEFIPQAQSIFLKGVLHNWDDEKCVKLLKNCWEALPEKGKVMVVEYVIPEQLGNNPESSEVIQLDFIMLLYFSGKERTEAEHDALAKAAGFKEISLFPVSAQGFTVLEFIK